MPLSEGFIELKNPFLLSHRICVSAEGVKNWSLEQTRRRPSKAGEKSSAGNFCRPEVSVVGKEIFDLDRNFDTKVNNETFLTISKKVSMKKNFEVL